MSAEDEYSRKAAEFVANNLLRKVNYPPGSEVQRYMSGDFYAHCKSKGQVLAKPGVFLRGYSGIIAAEFCLEPPEDITAEVHQKPLKGNVNMDGKVQKRTFWLSYMAFGIEWMGIRYSADDDWGNQCVGYSLKDTPTSESMIGSISDPDLSGHDGLGISGRSGIYYLETGDYRSPKQRITVDVKFDGIRILEGSTGV